MGLNSDNPFSNMYSHVYNFESKLDNSNQSIFENITSCNQSSILVKCPEAIKLVFNNSEPQTWVSGLAGLMERTMNCAGIGSNGNHDYYFKGTPKTNRTFMPESCKEKVVTFIDSKISLYVINFLEELASASVIAISIIVIFILFINTAGGYCLCCHPDRKDAQPTYGSPNYATKAPYQRI